MQALYGYNTGTVSYYRREAEVEGQKAPQPRAAAEPASATLATADHSCK